MSALKADIRKEAYLLAVLGLVLAVYKIWRYWGDENLSTLSRVAYASGMGAAVFGLSVVVIEYDVN